MHRNAFEACDNVGHPRQWTGRELGVYTFHDAVRLLVCVTIEIREQRVVIVGATVKIREQRLVIVRATA